MSERREFSRKIRAIVFLRAGGCCERCGARLKSGEGEIDHVIPCALGGDATADNAVLLCRPCHKPKTADDIRRIRKADRQRDRHTGAMPKSKRPLMGSKASGWKQKITGEWVKR